MPDREFQPQTKEAVTKPSLSGTEKFILLAFIIVMVTSGMSFARNGAVRDTQEEIQTAQDEGRVRGLKNRAIDCEQSIAMGVPMEHDHPCNDAEVLEFYDPDALAAALREARSGTAAAVADVPVIKSLLCRLLGLHDRNDPDCSAAETGT